MRSQTHVASDFGGVDVRFHDREYRLGEPMAWWPRDHARHGAWSEHAVHADDGDLEAYEEACLATCNCCTADLYVIVRFRETVPEAVLAVGLASEWPDGYPG